MILALWLLLTCVLGLTFILVQQANRHNARGTIEADLRGGAVLFDQLIEARLNKLTLGVRLVSTDWAFRQLYGSTSDFSDPAQRLTLTSGLQNYLHRLREAAFLMAVSLQEDVLADTGQSERDDPLRFPHPALLRAAEESDDYTATAFAVRDGRPVLLLAAPIQLPDPAGWIIAGFDIDTALAHEFKDMADLDVSFILMEEPALVAVSTLPEDSARELAKALRVEALVDWVEVKLAGEVWIGMAQALPGGGPIRCLLLRERARALAPHQRLERVLMALIFTALLVSSTVAVRLASGISRPVSDLTSGVARIKDGHYRQPVRVHADDELGRLAEAVNGMAAGLEERDRVRDLLGKAVSPEIAAELMRRPVELGGEERLVTVVFTDLRGFTSFSEQVSPAELVAVLNDYFTRVTGVIEAHGGIVDKFMGDAVMAVFGAPLERADHATRAVACSVDLLRALDQLNRERQTAGHEPLRTGIGMATGRVVAGNMGSKTRHNYTVMGDAANLAARLQDMTKAQGVSLLVAESTVIAAGYPPALVCLGTFDVRGRTEAIPVYTWRAI